MDPMPAPGLTPPEAAPLDPEKRTLARRSLSALGVLSVGSMTGTASSLYLVNHHPLLLIALSPLGRHLVLVAPIVDPVAFVVVAVLRRMAFYLACFQLGRALGPTGVVWIEARAARFARFVRWLERVFQRFSRSVVLVMSGPTVSALAGMSDMTLRVYVPLAVLGLVARMLLLLGLAEIVREPIEWLLSWIDAYWVPGTVILVLGTLAYQWRRARLARALRAGQST
jgi:membrane protein DedA with SNARE-associated domain